MGASGTASVGHESCGKDWHRQHQRRPLDQCVVCRVRARDEAGDCAGGIPGAGPWGQRCSQAGGRDFRCVRQGARRELASSEHGIFAMRRLCLALSALLLLAIAGDAQSNPPSQNKSKTATNSTHGFPQTVRVRMWYLRPPRELKLRAESGQAHFRKCATCADNPLTTLSIKALASKIQLDGDKADASELRITGAFQITSPGAPPIRADFPIEIQASEGHLLVTASMPMDEYLAGVLAGETGNFKSDEALRAMAVTARTYAMHFGSRHALDGFDFCDSTHCQNLHLASVDARLRRIVDSTSGEVLWYDGEPAATYYHANCGGTTEDGHYILGNDEQRAPYLNQHPDTFCVRSGANQWHS